MAPFIYIGSSDFVEMRTKGAYYVDKSLLIAQVVRSQAKVMLLPRPRRFGKTLNLSMLRTFFQRGTEHGQLFNDLNIASDTVAMAHQGAYPVVYLTLKDIRQKDWHECDGMFRIHISRLFSEHKELLLQAEPEAHEQTAINAILAGTGEAIIYQNALYLLTALLHRATARKVILLLDEYDSPIHEGLMRGYKDQVVDFMRNLLGAALKDNDHLEKAVITGILRVAKDSIFSGLNNLRVYGILEERFSDCFGFTEREVHQLLQDNSMSGREEEVKRWYNGYRFGNQTLYNPWSILVMAEQGDQPMAAHWIHTSGNDLIRDLVTKSQVIKPEDLERLLQGQPFVREIKSSVVLDQLTPETVWSLLLYSGYLTYREAVGSDHYDLRIPNLEVRTFFNETVRSWLGAPIVQGLTPMLACLLTENLAEFAQRLADMVRDVLSYHDTARPETERVYHVFLLGVLSNLEARYQVLSNQESGHGRYDLALIPRDLNQAGYVFELKRAEDEQLTSAAETALNQIQTQATSAALSRQGVQRIHRIGIGFSGKRVALAVAKYGEIQETHQAEAEPRYSRPAAEKDAESKARERFKLIVMIQTAQSLRGLPQDSEESLLQWDHAKLIAQAKALGLPTP